MPTLHVDRCQNDSGLF